MEKIKALWQAIEGDQVWSKVAAGLIVLIISYFFSILFGLLKGLKRSSFNPFVSIPYFLKMIFKFLLYPVIREVFMELLIENKIKLSNIISGEWRLVYIKGIERGTERVLIKKNIYYSRGEEIKKFKRAFILRDISINLLKNDIVFIKFNPHENKLHATEFLKIINKDTLQGKDSLGFEITYSRVPKNELSN